VTFTAAFNGFAFDGAAFDGAIGGAGVTALVAYVDPLAVSHDDAAADAIFGAGIDPFAVAKDAAAEDAEFGAGIDPFAVSH
jgi:hypothetical protein